MNETVVIINKTPSGRFIIEGRAKVIRHLDEDRYLVRFGDGSTVERYVDPQAQSDPEGYIERLNG